jgi:hypothetical protein
MGNSVKALKRRSKKRNKAKQQVDQAIRLEPTKIGLINPDQRVPSVVTQSLDIPGAGKLTVKILSDELIALNQEKAMEYINLPVFKGEREVQDGTVQYLFDCMKKNQFNWSNTQIATASYNGVVYKVNGQHTAWAVAYMGDSQSNFESPELVRETRYAVTNENQLRALYSTFDRNRVRTDGHINKVLLVNKPVTQGVWNNSINKLIPGIKLWKFGSTTSGAARRVLPDQIAATIEREIPELFRQVAIFLQDECKDINSLWRQGVVAAMFATFDKVPTKAPDFWKPVADGLGLESKDDPRYRLRAWLSEALIGPKKKNSTSTVKATDMYYTCVAQWNRWRKGEDTKMLRVATSLPQVR